MRHRKEIIHRIMDHGKGAAERKLRPAGAGSFRDSAGVGPDGIRAEEGGSRTLISKPSILLKPFVRSHSESTSSRLDLLPAAAAPTTATVDGKAAFRRSVETPGRLTSVLGPLTSK